MSQGRRAGVFSVLGIASGSVLHTLFLAFLPQFVAETTGSRTLSFLFLGGRR